MNFSMLWFNLHKGDKRKEQKYFPPVSVGNSSLKMAVCAWSWDLQHHSTDIKEKLVKQKRKKKKGTWQLVYGWEY